MAFALYLFRLQELLEAAGVSRDLWKDLCLKRARE
jgi:hypothetical protein